MHPDFALIELKDKIVAEFSEENWDEIALLTDSTDLIYNHSRLIRSLRFADPDYGGCVLDVIRQIKAKDAHLIDVIKSYISRKFASTGTYISALPSPRLITFAPSVFAVPDQVSDQNFVSVMMPFDSGFTAVYKTIKGSCDDCGLQCKRVDDIWIGSTIIQDIFELIFTSTIVVVDFTGKNPNVMYETGIAHTLGKHVVPLCQNIDDIPFDLRHHRSLKYLANSEGLLALRQSLANRLRTLVDN